MRRAALTLIIGLALVFSVHAQDWALRRFSDLQELQSLTDQFVEEGFTPAAIDVSEEFGVTMLFSRIPWWPATAYVIEEIDALSQLTDTVTSRIEDGWFPMDVSLQDDRYVLLFVDAPAVLNGWRIVGSEPSFIEVQRTLSEYRSEGFVPVGLSVTGDGQLAHLLLAVEDAEQSFAAPAVVGVPHDPEEAAAAIETMVNDGWTPVSMTMTPDEILVAFLDQR
jgi:non-ribosomal peptide synthetase component F